jgi:hypothetical protein
MGSGRAGREMRRPGSGRTKPRAGAFRPASEASQTRTERRRTSTAIRPPRPLPRCTGAFKQNPCSVLRSPWAKGRPRLLYADGPVHRHGRRVQRAPGQIRAPPPPSEAPISSDLDAPSRSRSTQRPYEASQPRDRESRDRFLVPPSEGLTSPSGYKAMMPTDTPHLQRRQDLRMGLGAPGGLLDGSAGTSPPRGPCFHHQPYSRQPPPHRSCPGFARPWVSCDGSAVSSTLQLHRLMTVSTALIRRQLGHLSPDLQARIVKAFVPSLDEGRHRSGPAPPAVHSGKHPPGTAGVPAGLLTKLFSQPPKNPP